MLAQARLDLGDEVADLGPLDRHLHARRGRERRQSRRAVREVEGKREEGDGGGRGEGYGRALGFGKRRRRRLGVHAVRARQKPAGDLDAGACSLAVIDESARALILDLVELVAVDGKRPAIGLRPVRGTRKRNSTAASAAAVMRAKAIHRSMSRARLVRSDRKPSNGLQ